MSDKIENKEGDGYTIKIIDTPVIDGINYVNIQTINSKGECKMLSVPIYQLIPQLLKSLRILGTAPKSFVENLSNIKEPAHQKLFFNMDEHLTKLNDAFAPLKELLDKYPNATSLKYFENDGYIIDVDLAVLRPQMEALNIIS